MSAKPVSTSPEAGAVAPVTPSYWDEACKHLSKRDRVMRKLIAQHGLARLYSRSDPFTTLARSIVGQQISVKAAQSVWNKLLVLLGHDPESPPSALVVGGLLDQPIDALRGVGLSARKVEYLRDLSVHFADAKVHVTQWADMTNEAIIEELIDIRGIGRWTAEMFLIFHLMRADVLPLDDLGLLKGISVNYFSGEPVSRAEARDIAEAWAPYRTVGTWYLWRSLDPVPVEY
jgi:DNA-3-methyladenine glycosylase II